MLKRSSLLLGFNLIVVAGFLGVVVVPPLLGLSTKLDLSNMLAFPSLSHPLGTDHLGRDLMIRISETIRFSVLPLWLSSTVATFVGASFAAFLILGMQTRSPVLKGLTTISQSVAALLMAIPAGVMVFAWSVWREHAGIIAVVSALSVFFVMRAFLKVFDLYRHDRYLLYWQAHEALGGSRLRLIWRYGFLSSWKRQLGELLSFHLRAAVIIEASLSYLGFGIQEPMPSFGNLLSSHFELYLKGHTEVLVVITVALIWTSSLPANVSGIIYNLSNFKNARKKVPLLWELDQIRYNK